MMFLLIKKNPCAPFPTLIPKVTSISHLFQFSFSSVCEDPKPPHKSHVMREYLITSCGLSPQRADTASKYTSDLTSPLRAESVRHFLKQHGFTDSDIRTIISGYPPILSASVSQTIEPNLQALCRVVFAEHGIRKFIISNPQALLLRSIIPRIEFWITFFDGNMRKFIAAFTRNRSLINLNIDKNVIPKIALLKDYGLSETQIGTVIGRSAQLFGRSITSMKMLLKKAEEMGFPRGSSLFVCGLVSLTCISPNALRTKLELFKSFGWTEGEFVTALNKNPFIVGLSEENIRQKMKFFVERAGCPQSYIAFRPTLLNFSLEKRLIPRLHVVEIINSNESVKKKLNLHSIMSYSEKTFAEKVVARYKEVVPKLHETYVAAFSGQL